MTRVRIGRPGIACDIFQVRRLPDRDPVAVRNTLGARFAQDDQVDLAVARRIGEIGPEGAARRPERGTATRRLDRSAAEPADRHRRSTVLSVLPDSAGRLGRDRRQHERDTKQQRTGENGPPPFDSGFARTKRKPTMDRADHRDRHQRGISDLGREQENQLRFPVIPLRDAALEPEPER